MHRLIALVALIPFLGGCYLTQAGAIKELSAERTARYQAHLTAQQSAVAEIVAALRDMDRGGMKLELTEDGRVKSISYTEPLNVEALTLMAKTTAYKEEPVVGVISEIGDFVMKATNLAVPFASFYYGHKNHVASQDASVRMNASNNAASTSMWGAYTSNFENRTVNTSVTSDVTSVTDVSVTDVSVTDVSVTDVSVTDVSVTDNTSVTNTSVTNTSVIENIIEP